MGERGGQNWRWRWNLFKKKKRLGRGEGKTLGQWRGVEGEAWDLLDGS